MNQDIIDRVQDELEINVRAAVQQVLRAGAEQGTFGSVDRQVHVGRRAVAEILKGVDVEALAVGTTFRAPHINNLSPDMDRLWVRTETGLLSLAPNAGAYLVGAVDPLKVHSVQAPAEDR